MKYLIISDREFVWTRGIRGCSHELDYQRYIEKHEHVASLFLVYNEFQDEHRRYVQAYKPDIIIFYTCIYPVCGDYVIEWCHANINAPIVVLGCDLFYIKKLCNWSGIQFADALINSVCHTVVENEYKRIFPDKYVSHLYPSINTDYYTWRNAGKQFDILLYGSYKTREPFSYSAMELQYLGEWNIQRPTEFHDTSFYPLRKRLVDLLNTSRAQQRYRIRHIEPTPATCWDCPIRTSELSTLINQSYMTVATTSRMGKVMQKYFEIGASGSVVLGNIPKDYRDVFEPYTVEVTEWMSDDEIFAKIDAALCDRERLKLLGKEFSRVITDGFGSHTSAAIDHYRTIMNELYRKYHNDSKIYIDKKYIGCNLTATNGGSLGTGNTNLGNVLFQVASLYGLCRQFNRIPDYSGITRLVHKLWEHGKFGREHTIFRRIMADDSVRDQGIVLRETDQLAQEYDKQLVSVIQECSDHITIRDSYLQSNIYFDKYRTDILDLFTIDDKSINTIKNKYPVLFSETCVSMHIRYNYAPNIQYISDYFIAAYNQLSADNIHVFIFSDNIKYCENMFKGAFASVTYVRDNEDYIDLWMMSLCTHNILSHSTFSWWGAYLNRNPLKSVIYPEDALRIHWGELYSHPVRTNRMYEHYLPEWTCLSSPALR